MVVLVEVVESDVVLINLVLWRTFFGFLFCTFRSFRWNGMVALAICVSEQSLPLNGRKV